MHELPSSVLQNIRPEVIAPRFAGHTHDRKTVTFFSIPQNSPILHHLIEICCRNRTKPLQEVHPLGVVAGFLPYLHYKLQYA